LKGNYRVAVEKRKGENLEAVTKKSRAEKARVPETKVPKCWTRREARRAANPKTNHRRYGEGGCRHRRSTLNLSDKPNWKGKTFQVGLTC